MSEDKRAPVPASAGDEAKAERLAAALRANLKRRKAQARAKDEPARPTEPAREPESGQ
jgi:hypothetical protein